MVGALVSCVTDKRRLTILYCMRHLPYLMHIVYLMRKYDHRPACWLKNNCRCSGKIKIETYNDVSSTKNDRVSGDAISTFHNNQQVKIEDNTDCTGQSENEATRGKRPYKMLSIPSHISVNNGSTNTYTCTICNKTFQTKLHVKYHIYCVDGKCFLHTAETYQVVNAHLFFLGKKPYECKTCHKQFVTKSDFEIHCINHHNAKKPFSCSVCSKGFPTSSKLNRHMQSHSAKKPFVCQDCGKGFSRKEYLKIHFLLHKEIKKFMCFECNRGFNNSSNLKKHKLTHSSKFHFVTHSFNLKNMKKKIRGRIF